MTATAEQATFKRRVYSGLQRLGRSLMLPIAALPAAGLLLRLGGDKMLGTWAATEEIAKVLGAAGGALFNWMPILFAVGIAVGFARKGDGSTGVAAVVGFFVFNSVIHVYAPISELKGFDESWYLAPIKWPYSVLSGIVVGLVTAVLWQRFHRIKLPPYLAFFGGRRFVPIINAFALMILGVIFGLIFPAVDAVMQNLGEAVTSAPVFGGALYGFFNRLLIPIGLHQLLNVPVWFIFDGGDINNFFDGNPATDAGAFMSGFFPIFMFALPAAALAIYRTAKPSQKKIAGGIMGSAALTSFLTGVTEPLEFAFMFVAWPLYVIHAVFTGISLGIVNALDIHLGFTFSAGAIDFLLNFRAPAADKAWLLIPIGLIFAVLYYFVFKWVITKWNYKTPGREDDDSAPADDPNADITAAPAVSPSSAADPPGSTGDGTARDKEG